MLLRGGTVYNSPELSVDMFGESTEGKKEMGN